MIPFLTPRAGEFADWETPNNGAAVNPADPSTTFLVNSLLFMLYDFRNWEINT
jgi:hypothetical protein